MKGATVEQTPAIRHEKKVQAAYKKYVLDIPHDKTPMSFADFNKGFAAFEAKSEAEDAVVVNDDVKQYLEARGFKIEEYVPTKGANQGKKGLYLINPDADIQSAGFCKLSKDRFTKTRERALLFLEAADLILGHRTIAQVLG